MNRFWKIINWLEEYVLIIGMTIMVVLNFANVVFRFILPQSPFSYSEELTIILFMWVTMFGISYGYRMFAHTVLDVFTKLLPSKFQPYIIIFATLCSMAFMSLMVYTSYFTIQNQIEFGQVTPGMKLPMIVNSGALFIGAIITLFSIFKSGREELIIHYENSREEVVK
ncbi:TRAP transporter small permease [Gudongella sp. DL1XJH-153]|uniref:TRAP transporter small permease n=1 Tax=Gudongella sp. DL1XJH-153 TaxID=3409804 RepID=UPI003BB752CC